MTTINFKLLSTFLSVARHNSFRRAANEVNLSLSAVSMQIGRLEEQLGVALFQRTTRKVELTPLGEQLMICARKAAAEMDLGLTAIRQAADLLQGHLSIACVPTVASTRLPAILTVFAKKYPSVAVHVLERPNLDVVASVRRRDVDFGIGSSIEKCVELQFEPIFTDEYCALLPRSFRDGGRASISLAELSRMPLLKLSGATTLREHVDEVLRAQGLASASSYEFQQVSTLIAMAEAGLGVALLPRISIPARTSLKTVRISKPFLARTISVMTLRGHSVSPSAARLIELCNEMLAPRHVAKRRKTQVSTGSGDRL